MNKLLVQALAHLMSKSGKERGIQKKKISHAHEFLVAFTITFIIFIHVCYVRHPKEDNEDDDDEETKIDVGSFELWPQTIIEAVVIIIVVGSSSTIPPYDHRSAWNPPSL